MKKNANIKLFFTGLILSIFMADISAQIDDWDDVVEHAVLDHGLEGEWDDRQVWSPAVIKDGDTLRMYYTGGNETLWEDPTTKIGYAWSLDGIEWSKQDENPVLSATLPWEGDWVDNPVVIKDGDTL